MDANERLQVEAAQKDPARFGELYERHFEQVYAFVARRVRDRATAEDVTAEVEPLINRAAKANPNLPEVLAVKGWLLNEQFRSDEALPLLLRGTQLVATLPSRLAALLQPVADLRLVGLPVESPEFVECMAWSPLYSQDPGHKWLRSMLAELAREI